MVVVDATVMVAALVDSGADGRWAESMLTKGDLVAPHLMPVEVANILRRAAAAGDVGSEVATLAHADLLRLPVQLVAYEPVANRAWELRENLTTYDAWYVALAEGIGAPLATLDRRLSRAPGLRCELLLPG
jgi:predicted nucleic acid-binding protein